MVDKTLYRIYESKSDMRCLDYYGNRPERDAVVLVGVLVGKYKSNTDQVEREPKLQETVRCFQWTIYRSSNRNSVDAIGHVRLSQTLVWSF